MSRRTERTGTVETPHLSPERRAERDAQLKEMRIVNQERRGNARNESIEALPPTQRQAVKKAAAVRFNPLAAWRAVSR
jgi:hypothetical protein